MQRLSWLEYPGHAAWPKFNTFRVRSLRGHAYKTFVRKTFIKSPAYKSSDEVIFFGTVFAQCF